MALAGRLCNACRVPAFVTLSGGFVAGTAGPVASNGSPSVVVGDSEHPASMTAAATAQICIQ
jgi:hypothetical protein